MGFVFCLSFIDYRELFIECNSMIHPLFLNICQCLLFIIPLIFDLEYLHFYLPDLSSSLSHSVILGLLLFLPMNRLFFINSLPKKLESLNKFLLHVFQRLLELNLALSNCFLFILIIQFDLFKYISLLKSLGYLLCKYASEVVRDPVESLHCLKLL